MTAQFLFGFREMAFFMVFFMFFFFKKTDIKKLNELEFLNLVVGCCQGTVTGCKSGVQVLLLKFFWFSRKVVLIIFSCFFFQKNLDIKTDGF